jgi:hypothetical protein
MNIEFTKLQIKTKRLVNLLKILPFQSILELNQY